MTKVITIANVDGYVVVRDSGSILKDDDGELITFPNKTIAQLTANLIDLAKVGITMNDADEQ